MSPRNATARLQLGEIYAEDEEKAALEDMRDTLYIREEFPCPRYIGGPGGLTVEHVRAWTNRYLMKAKSPLLCIRLSASIEMERTQDRGVIGGWGLTMKHRDGTFICPASDCVKRMAKKFGAQALIGNATGTAILRVLCKHSHGEAA